MLIISRATLLALLSAILIHYFTIDWAQIRMHQGSEFAGEIINDLPRETASGFLFEANELVVVLFHFDGFE